MVNFSRKKTCEISTDNYVLCSFELEKDPIFRICAIRMDLRVKPYYYYNGYNASVGFTHRGINVVKPE